MKERVFKKENSKSGRTIRKYVLYIYPKLRIGNCRFETEKEAAPLLREQRESNKGVRESTREHRGSIEESQRAQERAQREHEMRS